MVCKDALAVYYPDGMTAYFRPEGTTMTTILHEFYHHLVNCYGAKDMLDYQIIPEIMSRVTMPATRGKNEQLTAMPGLL